ncbi:MAG TPA: hypothetical protein VN428_15355 [Bryobacteraceae bacterium]|nr:hypothetical protein [Bryobacteraceae bacterium]
MATVISPYSDDRVPAVRAFNRRIATVNGYSEFRFPESAVPDLPPGEDRRIFQEYFLATENGDVRGAFMLRHQDFAFSGQIRRVAHYRLPMSEGVANKAYAGVALQMVRTAIQKQPLLFAIGMGGVDNPLPRFLRALGWAITAVPFYFYAIRPAAFFRHVQAVRQTAARRALADAVAMSGAGWAALRVMHRFRRGDRPGPFKWDVVTEFSVWADELWAKCAPAYAMAAVRDSASLNILYPSNEPRFVRIRVTIDGRAAGWALLADAQMQGHKHFGGLRLGVIADCMAEPLHAPEVIAAATAALQDRGVDLIVSNQLHGAWRAGLERAGYLGGPSNYAFAVSKQLGALVTPFEARAREIHINRGDGDGLVNLL